MSTLDHMLLPFGCYINHILADTTGDHGYSAGTAALLIRWWQFIRPNKGHRLCCSPVFIVDGSTAARIIGACINARYRGVRVGVLLVDQTLSFGISHAGFLEGLLLVVCLLFFLGYGISFAYEIQAHLHTNKHNSR